MGSRPHSVPAEPARVDPGLRRVAEVALQHYELGEHRLVSLAESFNIVLRVDTRSACFVLRIGPEYPLHPSGSAALEARWARELDTRGLPVPRVVPAVDGSPSVHVQINGLPGVRECTVLTWQPGRQPCRPLQDRDVADLAVLSARLHDASPPLVEQPHGSLSLRSVLHFTSSDRLDELDERARGILVAARDRAQRAVDELWRNAATPPRLLHADLTPANVVRDEHGLSAIDLQDVSWGHVEQDLAHTLYGITRGLDLAAGMNAFRTSYARVRSWPELNLDLLVDLVAARRVAMVNLAVHRQRPDLENYAARHAEALRLFAR